MTSPSAGLPQLPPTTRVGEHIAAEYRVGAEAHGRSVDMWKLRADRPEDHWFDCVVGWAGPASMLGVERIGATAKSSGERKGIRLSAVQSQRL